MARGQSELAWTNITRADLASPQAQEAWDMFLAAKAELERYLGTQATVDGAANEGDSFKFSYRSIGQGSVGMAIDKPASAKQQSGFGGLKRPADQREIEAERLAQWRERQAASGRRY